MAGAGSGKRFHEEKKISAGETAASSCRWNREEKRLGDRPGLFLDGLLQGRGFDKIRGVAVDLSGYRAGKTTFAAANGCRKGKLYDKIRGVAVDLSQYRVGKTTFAIASGCRKGKLYGKIRGVAVDLSGYRAGKTTFAAANQPAKSELI